MAGDIIKNTGEDLLMQASKFARFSNKAAYANSVARLAREYNRLLIERGIGERRSSLKKLDRIDVRGIYQLPQNKYGSPLKMDELPTELETDYVNFEEGAGSFLHCILPCFAEGVMQLNANLELHWKVLDADMETQAEDVKLELYHDEGFGWAPVIIAQVRIKAPAQAAELPYVLYAFDTDVVRIPCEGELPGWEAVFHAIPVQDLPWNGKDKELWQAFIHGASPHWKDGEASLVEGDRDKDWKVSEFGQVAGLAKLWVSAVLTLTDSDGNTTRKTITFTESYVSANTDADGYVTASATFTGLSYGTYTLEETEVPDNWEFVSLTSSYGTVNGETASFTISKENASAAFEATFTNEYNAPGEVVVYKKVLASEIDWSDGNPEFTFTLTKPDGSTESKTITFTETYVSANTDADGYVTASASYTDLVYGDYTLEETDMPAGWEFVSLTSSYGTVTDNSVAFTISQSNASAAFEATYVNEMVRSGKITIVKYGSDGKTVLSGVTFAISDEDGNHSSCADAGGD